MQEMLSISYSNSRQS